MKNIIITLMLALLLLAGCKKEPEYSKLKYESVDKTRTYRNMFVPQELRKQILGDKPVKAGGTHEGGGEKKEEKKEEKEESKGGEHESAKKEEPKEEKKTEPTEAEPRTKLLASAEFDRIPMKVYMHEKSDGVLQGRNIVLDYNAGGGELDLSEFVSAKRHGTFYIAIDVEYDGEGDFDVYYLSNTRHRKIGDEAVGSGCGSYYKITKMFNHDMKEQGFAVNNTDERHVSALAGTYYFIYKRPNGRVALSYLDITDTSHKDMLCRLQ